MTTLQKKLNFFSKMVQTIQKRYSLLMKKDDVFRLSGKNTHYNRT